MKNIGIINKLEYYVDGSTLKQLYYSFIHPYLTYDIAIINTWAVAVFRYGAGILQWKESELKNVDRKSRKTMEHYIRRAMWTDCTLRGKREVEA